MRQINVLTPGFVTPNGRAFLFPLLVHDKRLQSMGLRLGYFNAIENRLTSCDVLIIDSKFFARKWGAECFNRTLDQVADLADRSPSTVYFDQSDSTGWLQAQVLPYVTAYRKAQLLRDRRAYLQPHYGNRIYADYYHRRFGVEDEQPYNWRELRDEALLTKLGVSWNSGLADYGRLGPPRMALRDKLPFNFLLRYPTDFTSPYSTIGTKISCRIGVSYTHETVAYQRRRIQTILSRHCAPRSCRVEDILAECATVVSLYLRSDSVKSRSEISRYSCWRAAAQARHGPSRNLAQFIRIRRNDRDPRLGPLRSRRDGRGSIVKSRIGSRNRCGGATTLPPPYYAARQRRDFLPTFPEHHRHRHNRRLAVTSSQPINIALPISSFLPNLGGMEVGLHNIACGLVERGLRPVVMTSFLHVAQLRRKGWALPYDVRAFPPKIWWLLYHAPALGFCLLDHYSPGCSGDTVSTAGTAPWVILPASR